LASSWRANARLPKGGNGGRTTGTHGDRGVAFPDASPLPVQDGKSIMNHYLDTDLAPIFAELNQTALLHPLSDAPVQAAANGFPLRAELPAELIARPRECVSLGDSRPTMSALLRLNYLYST